MDKSAREAYVRFSNVQKSYDGVNLVVKDLNLDVQRGEFMTMLGPSGSGKTCLLYTSPSPRDRTRSRMPSSA